MPPTFKGAEPMLLISTKSSGPAGINAGYVGVWPVPVRKYVISVIFRFGNPAVALAFNCVLPLTQTAAGVAVGFTITCWDTFTTATPVSVHPMASVPVTTYVVVAVGEAVTTAPVVGLRLGLGVGGRWARR